MEEANYQHGVETNRVAMEGAHLRGGSDDDDSGRKQYKHFTWRQDSENIELMALVPDAIVGKKIITKNVKVSIKSTSLKVEIVNSSDAVIVLEGESGAAAESATPVGQLVPLVHIAELFQRINVDDSTWFVSGREIQVSLCKSSSDTWPDIAKSKK